MRAFEHIDATSVEDAVDLLRSEPDSAIIAGGTDLLDLMKNRLVNPSLLINVKTVGGLSGIEGDGASGLRVGSLATLTALGENPVVQKDFPILVDAIKVAASPQLRNMASVGGNICQRPRCWYYRESFDCFLRGAEACPAPGGQSRDAGLFGGAECYAVNPSDLAPALVALGASVVVQGEKGRVRIPVADFFVAPKRNLLSQNILRHDEMIVEVSVPQQPHRARGRYLKAMERKTWSFAQASVAIQLSQADGAVTHARIVLGGMAPVPWRATAAENMLRANRPSAELIQAAADAAVQGAEATGSSVWKVKLVRELVRRGLQSVVGL
ncbi:MAG: xanthine dehydrogenase family protein subunit M [Chloroflexi bacterium]|nr:xanthine dehydrogenase family protein subunit M [Chloroflexota bacterium]